MKKSLHSLFTGFLVLLFLSSQAQFTMSDVTYWVGTGSDSSILVIDFKDSTWDSTYAWGYLHNGSATGQDMLTEIAEADINLSVSINSGFLNDIEYGSHAGIGGTAGFYWSTWDGTSVENLASNLGLSTSLNSGSVFGCSFTDFDPMLAPGDPIAAFAPNYLSNEDVDFWVGNGTDTALLVIDFLDDSGVSSYVWGYAFDGTVSAETMLSEIDAADPALEIAIESGDLSDIFYQDHSGLAGSPDHWGTWSATNFGNWDINTGLSTTLENGHLFGCSYMNSSPLVRPGYPTPAVTNTGVTDRHHEELLLYPNPASDVVYLELSNISLINAIIKIFDSTGNEVRSLSSNSSLVEIPVHDLPRGMYNAIATNEEKTFHQRFIVQ